MWVKIKEINRSVNTKSNDWQKLNLAKIDPKIDLKTRILKAIMNRNNKNCEQHSYRSKDH